MMITWQH